MLYFHIAIDSILECEKHTLYYINDKGLLRRENYTEMTRRIVEAFFFQACIEFHGITPRR
jgi:hypothetical protein